ncbi:MOSC domain-containing protein [Streptosporangium sp. NPDC001681]|uniref:MOSC domain-containing protein n=1 Tax=Streptosporangium sp. NPDC001681 TaxID=3154395 RepID=UPI0033169F53
MHIVSVNVGRAVDAEWAGRLKRTAIDKTPVDGRVGASESGLAQDERADLEHHGSSDQALYAYAREDYDWWQAELGRELRDGMFGENLTTAGLDVNGAKIGERWRMGTVLAEVTGPRVPCSVFRSWIGEQGWLKSFTRAGRVGAYLRVVEPGELGRGDTVEIVSRPEGSVTVTESFRAYHGDRDLLRRLLAHPGHPERWNRVAERVLGRERG